jgi:biopolymer transport protein TolR
MGMASHHKRGKKRARMSEINVTPMVDVMLVLLIIFMVTAPMITAGINVDLPETNAAASRSDAKPLEITVDREGKIYIAQTRVARKDLGNKLVEIHKDNPDRLIYLRGDKKVNYGRFAEVMGEVSAAGFKKITLLTGKK